MIKFFYTLAFLAVCIFAGNGIHAAFIGHDPLGCLVAIPLGVVLGSGYAQGMKALA